MRFILLLVMLVLAVSSLGAGGNTGDMTGLLLKMGNNGSGLGGFYSTKFRSNARIDFEGSLYFIRENLPLYDPWTGRMIDNQSKRLFFLPLEIGYRRLLFADELAETFYPTLAFNIGPNIFFDLAEKDSFKGQWSGVDIGLSYAISIDAGAEFRTTPKNTMMVSFGYTLFRFSRDVDQSKDYSTVCLKFRFGF